MSKSLKRSTRQFGNNIKNTLQDQQIEEKLALKPRDRKKPQPPLYQLKLQRPQMRYFNDIMKNAFTNITYPNILKGPQKIKKNIQALIKQVTQLDCLNNIWNEDLYYQEKSKDQYFFNKQTTLEKRTQLIDWIIEIHTKYTLRQETLHLTVRLIDQFAQKNNVNSRYQLLGIACLFMSAKYQQIELPKFQDYYRLIQNYFKAEQMIALQSQVLSKTKFLIVQKLSALWYMQAFAIEDLIFPTNHKQNIHKNAYYLQKQRSTTISKQRYDFEERFESFMNFSKYLLNLVLVDYKIMAKFKEDTIGISALLLTSNQKEFMDANSKGLLKYFVDTKVKLIEQNEKGEQITKQIKKCMKKIQGLYLKREQKRFEMVNKKFNMR